MPPTPRRITPPAGYRPPAVPTPIRPAPAPEPAPAAKGPGSKPRTPPVVQLVKADPPTPTVRTKKVHLHELVRPLLDEIEASGDRDWWRVITFASKSSSAFQVKKLRAVYPEGWEFRSAAHDGGSAIYVRAVNP